MPESTPAAKTKYDESDVRQWRRDERGEIPAVPEAAPRVALVYPNLYSVGMSSLGYQSVLASMRREGLGAERFFAETPLVSVDSETPIHRFDIIAFSVAFESDWLNVLRILQLSGVPLKAEERGPRHPMVVAGGVCVGVNRSPVWPFVDLFVHGEGQAVIPALAEELRREGQDRRELLLRLSKLRGVEVTSGAARAYGLDELDVDVVPDPPKWEYVEDLDDDPCVTPIITPHAEFSDMALLDLARGCPNHCTFCWIGHNAPPFRVSSRERIAGMTDFAMAHTKRLGLISSAVGAHPEIDAICDDLRGRGARISYSSLRVEEATPTMLRALAESGQKSVTIAPEAGSDRVRRLLGKRLSDERILEFVDQALAIGMRSVKLYFMTGVPTETEDEADEIVGLCGKVRERMLAAGKTSGRIGTLTINLGLFVPKPNTPLMRIEGDLDFRVVSKRLKRLAKALRRIPNTRVMASSPELSGAQGILSAGGAESVDFLLDVLANDGDWRGAFRRFNH